MQLQIQSDPGVVEAEDVQVRVAGEGATAQSRFVASVDPEGVVDVISNSDGEIFSVFPVKPGDFLITFDDGDHKTRLAGEVIEEGATRVAVTLRGPVRQAAPEATPQAAPQATTPRPVPDTGSEKTHARGPR